MRNTVLNQVFQFKTSLKLSWLVSGLLLISSQAAAVWYEASGSARIQDGNLEQAKQQAKANAIRNASLYAGASISSVQQINNGLLVEDSWSFQSKSEIAQVQVISEHKNGDSFTVTIRADIFAEPSCSQGQLSHSLTVVRFPLAHRSQASYGGIYELGGATSKVLHGLFDQQSDRVISHLWLDEVVDYQPDALTPEHQIDELARTLARKTNSQYILLGQIRDISVSQDPSLNLTFWTYPIRKRALSLEVDLIDGISGDRLQRFHYQDRVPWDFSPEQHIDPYSADFWTSGYGKAWGTLLSDVQHDVEASLSCQPSVAHIINRQEQRIIVGMGSQDGLHVGQKAKLTRQSTFLDSFGRVKTSLHASGVELEVIAVEPRQAMLKPKQQADMANIQNQDLVIFNP